MIDTVVFNCIPNLGSDSGVIGTVFFNCIPNLGSDSGVIGTVFFNCIPNLGSDSNEAKKASWKLANETVFFNCIPHLGGVIDIELGTSSPPQVVIVNLVYHQ